MATDQWEEAQSLISTMLDISPKDGETWLMKAQIEVGRGQFGEAIVAFDAAEESGQDLAAFAELRALAAEYDKQFVVEEGESVELTDAVRWQMMQALLKVPAHEIALRRLIGDLEVWRPVAPDEASAKELFQSAKLAVNRADWRDGAVVLKAPGRAGTVLGIPVASVNHGIRADVLFRRGTNLALTVRQSDKGDYTGVYDRNFFLGVNDRSREQSWSMLAQAKTRESGAMQRFSMSFVALGDELVLSGNGVERVRTRDRRLAQGVVGLSVYMEAESSFMNIEVAEFGDKSQERHVRQLYFNNSFRGWRTDNSGDEQMVTDLSMAMLPRAHHALGGLALDGAFIRGIELGLSAPPNGEVQLRWITAEDGDWDSSRQVVGRLVKGTAFDTMVFELAAHPKWKGSSIIGIQLYDVAGGPGNTGGEPMVIDYIVPISTE
jgi:hypothetical protein